MPLSNINNNSLSMGKDVVMQISHALSVSIWAALSIVLKDLIYLNLLITVSHLSPAIECHGSCVLCKFDQLAI